MRKNFKLTFVGLFIFMFSLSTMTAYDGTIFGGCDGSFSRYEFIQQASNMELAYSIVEKMELSKIEKFFNINEDTLDEEDANLLDDVENYINDNYTLKNRDGYSFAIIRSNSDDFIDGWIVFFHYSQAAAEPYYYYLYYFSAIP